MTAATILKPILADLDAAKAEAARHTPGGVLLEHDLDGLRKSFPSPPDFGATILMMPVADHEAEIARLTAERDAAILAKDCFQRMTRAHWEALCAMRNSINEYIPMPNTDSGPLFSPEDGPIYADIAERVIADLTESRAYALALEQELRDRATLQPDPEGSQADLSDAARDVLAERARQISVEGWTPGHDDTHEDGEMAEAAGCYALNAAGWKTEAIRGCWPIKWMAAWFKPTDPRRDLVKAGALCIAEIERLDRALTPPADLAAKIGGAE